MFATKLMQQEIRLIILILLIIRISYPNNYRTIDASGKGNSDKYVPNSSVTRTFTKSGTAGARILKSPLWYAAKWGSYDVDVSSAVPTGGSGADAADPDGYFLVTNASTLKDKLEAALKKAQRPSWQEMPWV